jgi:hypothetical protein
MRLPTILVLLCTALLCHAIGCATSAPTYVKAEVFHRDSEQTTVIADAHALGALLGALPPGVGMGRKSAAGVFGMPTHSIRLTRDTGKVDLITVYNNGAAWTEGRGDWPLPDSEREQLARWLVSAPAGPPE